MCTNVFVEITKRYGFLYPFRRNLTTVNINVVLLLGSECLALLRTECKFYSFFPPKFTFPLYF
jgi:hypothetical protein